MQSPGSQRLFAAWKFTAEIGKLGQKMLKGLQFHENEALVLYTNFFIQSSLFPSSRQMIIRKNDQLQIQAGWN